MRTKRCFPRLWRIVLLAVVAAPSSASARAPVTYDLAILGDVPYGPGQQARFPAVIDSVNKAKLRLVVHLGDIKSSNEPCTDAYYTSVREQLAHLRYPVVYTPGDNEWADCHRAASGGFVPTERLASLRTVFFPMPGQTLGSGAFRVQSQGRVAPGPTRLVENQMWWWRGVVLSTTHVVGSGNGLAPWTGTTAATPEQQAEHDNRLVANLAWIDRTFDQATRNRANGVVIAHHANMWIGGQTTATSTAPIVARIAERARRFGKPVLLLEGDSHTFLRDRPLVAGSPFHGVSTAAPNLQRVVVPAGTAEWLRLRIRPTTRRMFFVTLVPTGVSA